jgi:hypothetical protein
MIKDTNTIAVLAVIARLLEEGRLDEDAYEEISNSLLGCKLPERQQDLDAMWEDKYHGHGP